MDDTRGVLPPDEWSRLEALWETARGLPAAEREEMLAAHAIDGALREEFESLLGRANAAEAFFDRLLTAVPQTNQAEVARRPDSSARSDTDPLLGTTVGHYEIVARLGQGCMGVVYRAVDLRRRRTVVIKLLRNHTPTDVRAKERLLIEARAAAALDHANISTIYEVGETAEKATYIAMAYYAGETLQQVMQRGPLPLSIALDYATQIARGSPPRTSAASSTAMSSRPTSLSPRMAWSSCLILASHACLTRTSHEGVTPAPSRTCRRNR